MDASVILTRPEGKNEQLAARLRDAGLEPLVLPALSLRALPAGERAFPLPAHYDLLVFVSGNAVRFYAAQLRGLSADAAWPPGLRVAAVGAATARAAQRAGVDPGAIIQPDPRDGQDSEALWKQLSPRLGSLRRVLIVRGNRGREWLGARLEEAGLRVHRHAAYERRPAQWSAEQGRRLAAALEGGGPCICLLTSSEGVDAVYANLSRLGLENAWPSLRFLVVHERIAGRLQSVSGASGKVGPRMVKICQPSDDAIFQALVGMASPSESS